MIPRPRQALFVAIVVALLAALPVAVWLDLQHIAATALARQASDVNSIVSSIRAYYSNNVVARVIDAQHPTQVLHNYEAVPGAIPIPATLSLELGRVIDEKQRSVGYRFISDLPFTNRAAHPMDAFEKAALAELRANPSAAPVDVAHSGLSTRVRVVTPILMGSTCVACHNSHPESPKRDWKVGDVRGIQEVAITQRIAGNIFSFKYLLAYFAFMAIAGASFITIQQRQAATIRGMNKELETSNEFLASLSMKIGRAHV